MILDRVIFRGARDTDLDAIVRLLADDPLGSQRERWQTPLPQSYRDAFEAIERDPNNELVAAVLAGQVVGVLQLTFIPYLTHQGGWRALIEGVRVAKEHRSLKIGQKLFAWAIERARARGCHMVQLTTSQARIDAVRFYERLGFTASHEGMKLYLTPDSKSGPGTT